MGFKNLAKGIVKNLGDAHTVEGLGGAYLRRAATGAGIGAVAGGTLEAMQGGSFGEGATSGAVKGGIVGAGTVAYKAAGLGKDVFEEGTHRLGKVKDKGTLWRNMWNNVDTANSQMNKATDYLKATKSKAMQGEQLNLFDMNAAKNATPTQATQNLHDATRKTYVKPTAAPLTGKTKESIQHIMHGVKTGKYHIDGNNILNNKGRIIF